MYRKAAVFLAILSLFLLVWPAGHGLGLPGKQANSSPPDPLVQFMIDQVDTGRIYKLAGDLSGEWPVNIAGQPYTIKTRNSFSGEPIQKAAQYLYEFYQGRGLVSSYDPFEFFGRTLFNVVAEKKGERYPERIYLLTSHYDNAPGGDLAPGADDNASGTAGVMLAAEILSRYQFDCTLRFVNFAGEEQGLEGSEAYAGQVYAAGDDVRGVVNLDMIAWNEPGSQPGMDLHAKAGIPGTLPLAELFQQVVDAYDLDLDPEIISNGTNLSDHASFWTYDYPAILAIEDLGDFNPNYHKTSDRLENLADRAYFANMVKASLATLAHLGCLVDPGWGTLSGKAVDLITGQPVPGAQIYLRNPEAGYERVISTGQAGTFQVQLPAAIHLVTADAFGYAPTMAQELVIPLNQEIELTIHLDPVEEHLVFIPLSQNRSLLASRAR